MYAVCSNSQKKTQIFKDCVYNYHPARKWQKSSHETNPDHTHTHTHARTHTRARTALCVDADDADDVSDMLSGAVTRALHSSATAVRGPVTPIIRTLLRPAGEGCSPDALRQHLCFHFQLYRHKGPIRRLSKPILSPLAPIHPPPPPATTPCTCLFHTRGCSWFICFFGFSFFFIRSHCQT